MKIALVHDYIKEYGGAERVLEVLCELYPDAPIYTSFYAEGSIAYEKFKGKQVIPSWVHYIPFFATKLHSPLRFLAPLIWGSFSKELSQYDVVISSASWYVTKGFGKGDKREEIRENGPIEICYCHTPPRWLYGYKTSVEWQKYWPVRVYAALVGHFMRMYDFKAAQRVDYFIANSKEVQSRIKKFYRQDSTVIYPPVSLLEDRRLKIEDSTLKVETRSSINHLSSNFKDQLSTVHHLSSKEQYYLIVARLVGAKGLELAIEAAIKKGFNLKIVGASSGYYAVEKAPKNVEFLGFIADEELVHLYTNAKAFLALATDEDFGITPVEAMLCGTPVIAYNGGGYKETVLDKKTGVFFSETTVDSLLGAMKKLDTLKIDPKDCINQAQKFSKSRFKESIKNYVLSIKG